MWLTADGKLGRVKSPVELTRVAGKAVLGAKRDRFKKMMTIAK